MKKTTTILIAVSIILIISAIFVLTKSNRNGSFSSSSTKIKDVYAGFMSSGAVIKNNGRSWTWGENLNGQLGDGTREERDTPVQVKKLENIIDMSLGKDHAIALTNDHEVFEWGANYGYGDRAPRDINGKRNDAEGERLFKRTLPNRVESLRGSSIEDFISAYILSLIKGPRCWPWETEKYLPLVSTVLACGQYSLALKQDGTVWAWGRNIYGVLGPGQNSLVPVQIENLFDVTSLACGYSHSLALRRDGTVWAWGNNDYGLLGIGTSGSYIDTPVQIPSLTAVMAIFAGAAHNFALDSNGDVWGWGDNKYFEINKSPEKLVTTPVRLDNVSNVRLLAAGTGTSFALLKDGSVWTWGHDISKVTENESDIRPNPTELIGLNDVVSLKCRGNYVLALKSDGTAWEWGWTSRWQEYQAWAGHPEYKGRGRVMLAEPTPVNGL